jgi:hypothetical protein
VRKHRHAAHGLAGKGAIGFPRVFLAHPASRVAVGGAVLGATGCALLGVLSLVTGTHPLSVAAAIGKAGRGKGGSGLFALVVAGLLVVIAGVAFGMVSLS